MLEKQVAAIAQAQQVAEAVISENKTLREQVATLTAQVAEVTAKVVEAAELTSVDEALAKLQTTLATRE